MTQTMQNKANFQKAPMFVNINSHKDYENSPALRRRKNKPKQTQPVVSKVEPPVVSLPALSAFILILSVVEVVEGSNLFQGPAKSSKVQAAELSNALYKTVDNRYDGHKRRCGSTVEHSFRKAGVVGSIPTIGCVDLQDKYNSLKQILKELGKVVVAYSGGEFYSTFHQKIWYKRLK